MLLTLCISVNMLIFSTTPDATHNHIFYFRPRIGTDVNILVLLQPLPTTLMALSSSCASNRTALYPPPRISLLHPPTIHPFLTRPRRIMPFFTGRDLSEWAGESAAKPLMTQRRPRTSKTNFTLTKRTALARSHAYKWPIDAGHRLSAL